MQGQDGSPFQLVTDKLRSYAAARRELGLSATHRTKRYGLNRAAVFHQHTREWERQMRRFKSEAQVQRFLSVHSSNQNLFRVARHRLKAVHYRLHRQQAFTAWEAVTCMGGAIGRHQAENRIWHWQLGSAKREAVVPLCICWTDCRLPSTIDNALEWHHSQWVDWYSTISSP